MTENDASELGRRIARGRRRRGLSQREFAAAIGRSEAWVSQVERGIRVVDRMSVLEAIAEKLQIPLADLAPAAPAVAASQQPAAAARLRLILSESYALAAVLGEERVSVERDLSAAVERAWELVHAAQYDEFAGLLVRLLPELEMASRHVGESERKKLSALLAKVYHASSAALTKLGQFDVAWVAADRAIAVAERCGDPMLVAAGAFRLALVFQSARHFDQVIHTATAAAAVLKPRAHRDDPQALSLFGAFHLQLAVAAARQNEADRAEKHLRIARTTAQRLGVDRNDYETEFGPTNVSVHEVAVAVELGDAGQALRIAETIDASTLSPERRARLLIDVARAWTQRRRVAEAVTSLELAERLTPEQIQQHPLVAATIGDLLRMDSAPPPALRALAERANVTV